MIQLIEYPLKLIGVVVASLVSQVLFTSISYLVTGASSEFFYIRASQFGLEFFAVGLVLTSIAKCKQVQGILMKVNRVATIVFVLMLALSTSIGIFWAKHEAIALIYKSTEVQTQYIVNFQLLMLCSLMLLELSLFSQASVLRTLCMVILSYVIMASQARQNGVGRIASSAMVALSTACCVIAKGAAHRIPARQQPGIVGFAGVSVALVLYFIAVVAAQQFEGFRGLDLLADTAANLMIVSWQGLIVLVRPKQSSLAGHVFTRISAVLTNTLVMAVVGIAFYQLVISTLVRQWLRADQVALGGAFSVMGTACFVSVVGILSGGDAKVVTQK